MRCLAVSLTCCCLTLTLLFGQEATEPEAPTPPPSVTFSKASGLITEPISVEASCSDVAAVLYYTVDGTTPTLETALPYNGPITITKSTTVRMLAVVNDQVVAQDSAGYLFTERDLLDFNSNLPLVVVDSFGTNIDDNDRGNSQSEKRPVFAVFVDTNADSGRSKLRDSPQFVGRAGMRVRGQTSTMFPKKQYSFETWDATDEDTSVSLLGFPKESDWVLHAPFSDKTLMRNVLAYRLFREMGHYAVGCKYVELFHNDDGGKVGMEDYRGVYVLMEKIKRDKNRVAISKLVETMTSEPEITGGYIFKKDKGTWKDVNFQTERLWNEFGFVDPDEPNDAQFKFLSEHMAEFERVLVSRHFADPDNGYAKYLDVASFIDVHIHVEMCRNIDGFRLSTYFHKDREGKIVMGPVWDYNLSLGNTTMRGGEYPEGWYSESISPQDFTYLDRLFDDPNFVIQHWDRYYQLRQTTLRTDKLMRQIDDIADHLAEAQARNFKRWPYLGSQVWQNPAGYRSRNTHRKEVDWLKRWLTKRLAWMDEQFTPPPTISLASGQVTAGQSISLTAHSGAAKIYLSMDGSDPRQTSGTPATNATAASPNHQMTLKQSSQVRARALVNGQWGALASADYIVEGSLPIVNRSARYWPWLGVIAAFAVGIWFGKRRLKQPLDH